MTSFNLYVFLYLICLLFDQAVDVLICGLLVCDLLSDGFSCLRLQLIELPCFGFDQLFVILLLQLDLFSDLVKEILKRLVLEC